MPISDQSAFPAIAGELLHTAERAFQELRAMPDSEAARPRAPGKWSAKQTIGHLIDSAANNHQRFVRAQQAPKLQSPGYEQDHWVTCQRYDDRPWDELVALWHGYNRHLAHVIKHIPDSLRSTQCSIGTNAPVTLAFLAHDYVVHLRHHLAQLEPLKRVIG
jgi:hypothetical protein